MSRRARSTRSRRPWRRARRSSTTARSSTTRARPRTSRSTISSRATSARARSSTSSHWARTSIRTSRPPTRAASAIWKRASPRRTPSWSAPTRPARSSTRRSNRTSAMRTSRADVWCSTVPRRCRTMCAASSAGCAAFPKIRSTSSRSVSAAATAASRTFWWRT